MPIQKITKNQFVNYITDEDNIEKTVQQQADELGISRMHCYNLRKKFANQIVDCAKEISKQLAAEQIFNLRRNAKGKDTTAANSLLEIAKVKVKDSLIPGDDTWKVTIEKIAPAKQER